MPDSTTLSRRNMLAGTAAAAVLVAVPTVNAAQPDAMVLRAINRFPVGDMRVAVIDDASFTFPAAAFAANQPEGTIAPFLGRFGLPDDSVTLYMQVTLVETGQRNVLLDTGMGDVTFPGNDHDGGRLAAGLAAIGLSADDITDVVLSHGHPDLVGGCTANGDPAFKNAAYHMPPKELEFWTQKPGTEANFPNFMLGVGDGQLLPLKKAIKPYGGGDEVAPGITAISAPGHTLDHHAFMIANGGDRMLHMIDAAVHYLVGTEEPDWALAVEMDPSAAADTRRRLLAKAADERLLVAGYHFPFPGVGRIVAQGQAWRFVPMQTA